MKSLTSLIGATFLGASALAGECDFSLSLTNYSKIESNIVTLAVNLDQSAHKLDGAVSSTNSYALELNDYYSKLNEFNRSLRPYTTNGVIGKGITSEGKSFSLSGETNGLGTFKFNLHMHIGELNGVRKALSAERPSSPSGFSVVTNKVSN